MAATASSAMATAPSCLPKGKVMKLAVNILKENGINLALKLGNGAFDTCLFDCHDPYLVAQTLKCRKKRNCRLFAKLQAANVEAFALVYDFVDAFVISDYDDLNECIDPLVNLRLYNDEYKEIFLRIPDNYMNDELDEVISFSKLSNIDGLVISNPKLLVHALDEVGGILQIIADNITTLNQLESIEKDGVDIAAIPYTKPFACFISGYLAKRLKRTN